MSPQRLTALRSTGLMDGPREEPFDVFTRLASRMLQAPIALISLVDADRQFFKSLAGLPEPWATARQTPIAYSFCQHVVTSGQVLVITDAREHPLVRDNPSVSELGVAAYLGAPLTTREGHQLGSLCVIDSEPRDWSDGDIAALKDLAVAVMSEVEWRRQVNSSRRDVSVRDQFMAILSHELRTPLSPALLMATAMAADQRLPQDARDDVELIRRNIEVETRLIDDLLDVSRIASGKLELRTAVVDAHALIRSAVALCHQEITAKGVSLRLDLDAERSHVLADGSRLQQVFWNLLKNAVKFTPRDREIAFETFNREERLVIRVRDQGMGIAPHKLRDVFDAFEQTDPTVTRNFGGLGLGLSICKGVVEAHHGSITALSEGQNRGAIFQVELPLTSLPETAHAPTTARAPDACCNILLVDDHVDTLTSMRRLLSAFGHRVTTSDSVKAALAAAAKEQFDLLISDIGLADGSGVELMEALRGATRFGGIAVSGYGMEADIQASHDAGFARHLTKPVEFAKLHRAIQDLATGVAESCTSA